jgi:hypothetical protein
MQDCLGHLWHLTRPQRATNEMAQGQRTFLLRYEYGRVAILLLFPLNRGIELFDLVHSVKLAPFIPVIDLCSLLMAAAFWRDPKGGREYSLLMCCVPLVRLACYPFDRGLFFFSPTFLLPATFVTLTVFVLVLRLSPTLRRWDSLILLTWVGISGVV